MNNELTQDAEESVSTEKTAEEVSGSTTTTEETSSAAPVSDDAAAAAAQTAPEKSAETVEVAPITSESSASASNFQSVENIPSGEIDFGAILEQFEQEQTVFNSGELVNGTIVGISDRGVLVDFGHKSEGIVPLEEFTGADGEMTAVVGDTFEVIIRSMHSSEGAPILSRQDALGRKVWDDIEAAFNAETPVVGKIVDKTKGGLKIDLNGIEAFMPGSQIDSRPARGLDSYIGQEIEAQVIKFSRRRNNIVLSRKIITDKVVNVQKAETMSKIDVGYVIEGTIKNLTEYGAFVDIGGIDGLLHVTDMSWGRLHHPGDQFKVGDNIQVKVLKLDHEKEKISLGYKQLLPDPWSTVVEVYPVNTKLSGKVSSVTDYGVFVELESGVEGLVHVSEISWSRRAQSPKRIFNKGQDVEVQVLGVDTVEKRISLGMKQFQENPWDMVDIKYPIGAKVIGKVRNLTDFGAFIELEEGIDGLVHVSDITWTKKIKHPKDVLKKDQEVEAIVTNIDKRGQRLSLSMKDLTPSAWEGFAATHKAGDVVKGKVSRFTNFGVFVELGEGLEGLCHISELSDERIENPESVVQLEQEMDFKILRIEQADQKIGLSARAVGKDDEPIVDSRSYTSEAKGGMASLGELAKLKFGADAEEEVPEEDAEAKKEAKKAAKKVKAEEFAAREAEAALAAENAEAPAEDAVTEETAEVEAAENPAEEAQAEVSAEEPAAEEVAEAATEEPAIEAATEAENTVAEETSDNTEAVAEVVAEEPATEEAAEVVEAVPSEEAPTEEDVAEVSADDSDSEDSEKKEA